MENKNERLEILAALLSYPTEELTTKYFEQSKSLSLPENYPDEMNYFWDKVRSSNLAELQEMYTTTFDIQAVCCMDVGYVLFGEDYKRGEFLVQVSRLLKEHGVSAGTELADHLCNILRLLSVMPLTQQKLEFVNKLVGPAVAKMLENFSKDINCKNPYYFLLKVVGHEVTREFFLHDSLGDQEVL